VEKVKDAKKRGALAMPDEEVTYGTYHLLALMKLRSYGAAADELAALGDLDSPHYQYEQHPLLYPGKSGQHSFKMKLCFSSCFPFSQYFCNPNKDRLGSGLGSPPC
jgi:hypothetical protein